MEGAARGRPASRLRTCRFLRPLWFCSGLSPFPQGRIAPPLLLPPPHLSGGSHPLVEIGKPGRQVGVRNIPASQRKKLRFGGLGARPAAAASAQGGRGHVCGAGAPGALGKARGRCERRPGVGSPPGAGRGEGAGAGRHAALRPLGAGPSPSSGSRRCGPASPASTRAHARRGPARSAASPIAPRRQPLAEPAAGALACSAGLGGAQRPGPGGCGPGRPGS